jgi:serine/threonine-protein kinase
MGDVYRAHDTRLDRAVAIKILPESFAYDAERLARFEREARVLATLNHPHIGAIYGVVEADGLRGLVLELVDGETLAARLRRGPMPIADALSVAQQIADALEAAHEKGIVHRDLKPANIAITPEGRVKVLDFGLAEAMGSGVIAGVADAPTVIAGGTREGIVLGTAAYMSPEQARGQAVDRRTDLWAFGCVLFEMLTGRAPFARATPTGTLAYATGTELESGVLTEVDLDGRERRTLGVPRSLHLYLSLSPDGRSLATTINSASNTDIYLMDIESGRLDRFSFDAVEDESPLWSPDGTQIAYSSAWVGEQRRIFIKSVRSGTPERLVYTGKRHLHLDAWSPDGRWLAFTDFQSHSADLWLLNLEDTSRPVPVGTTGANEALAAFSPDGRWLLRLGRNRTPRGLRGVLSRSRGETDGVARRWVPSAVVAIRAGALLLRPLLRAAGPNDGRAPGGTDRSRVAKSGAAVRCLGLLYLCRSPRWALALSDEAQSERRRTRDLRGCQLAAGRAVARRRRGATVAERPPTVVT